MQSASVRVVIESSAQPEIMEDIWQGICSAEAVLVDLTGRNPNVLHELGLLLSFREDFVLVVQNISDIPAPLSRYRAVVYDANGQLTNRLRKELLALACLGTAEPLPATIRRSATLPNYRWNATTRRFTRVQVTAGRRCSPSSFHDHRLIA